MTDSLLLTDPQPGVRLLTINRPHRRNALDRATYGALGDALTAADADGGVHAIVLTGAKAVSLTAGNDLSDFQDTSDTGPSAGLTFLRALSGCGKPEIAAVEGFAVGIGTTLLLHCDLAYAGAGPPSAFPSPISACARRAPPAICCRASPGPRSGGTADARHCLRAGCRLRCRARQ